MYSVQLYINVVLDSRYTPILVYKDTTGMTNHMISFILYISGFIKFRFTVAVKR